MPPQNLHYRLCRTVKVLAIISLLSTRQTEFALRSKPLLILHRIFFKGPYLRSLFFIFQKISVILAYQFCIDKMR